MLFLDFWDDVFQNLGTLVERLLNTLWILLCQIVYPFISTMFTFFTNITGSLTNGKYADDINTIIGRVIMILTIVMTFYIVFEFVKYTVTPDSITDKEKGAMPLFARIIIAILLLAFVPKIFTKASEFQQKVIETNVIGKVILGAEKSNESISSLGKEFSGDLFSSFVHVSCYSGEDKDSGDCYEAHEQVNDMVKKMKTSGIMPGVSLTFSNTRIRFAGLLALVVGCFALYVIFLYCKDIALREVQFLFLQIISPIAIMSYIAPKKDGMFQKWMKQSITTYLDVFIRLAALSFMLLMINLLGTKLLYEGKDDVSIMTYIFLIIGLMMFLKKVPKLLQELFPSSGAASIGMGFSGKDRKGILGDAIGATRRAAARTAGAAAGIGRTAKAMKDGTLISDALKNKKGKIGRMKKLGTYANAMGRSAYSGYQAGKDGKIGDAVKASQETVQKYESIVAAGGTVLGHDYRVGHYQNAQVDLQVKLDMLKQMSDSKSAVNSAIGEIKFRKQMDTIAATLQARGDVDAANAWSGEIKKFEKTARNYASGNITEAEYQTQVKDLITKFNTTHYGGDTSKHVFTTKDGAGNIIFDDIGLNAALDSGNTSVYGAITTRMKEASVVAKEISKQTFMITEEKPVLDSSGSPVIGRDGKPVVTRVQKEIKMPKMLDDGTMLDAAGNPIVNSAGRNVSFADYIGDFTDAATTAKINIEADVETKKIQKNAEGKK